MESGSSFRSATGRTVRQLRSERGWTLRVLSEHAGLSVPYLSEIENGVKEPSGAALEQIGRAFDLSPASFLDAITQTLRVSEQETHRESHPVLRAVHDFNEDEISELLAFAEWLRWRRSWSQATESEPGPDESG